MLSFSSLMPLWSHRIQPDLTSVSNIYGKLKRCSFRSKRSDLSPLPSNIRFLNSKWAPEVRSGRGRLQPHLTFEIMHWEAETHFETRRLVQGISELLQQLLRLFGSAEVWAQAQAFFVNSLWFKIRKIKRKLKRKEKHVIKVSKCGQSLAQTLTFYPSLLLARGFFLRLTLPQILVLSNPMPQRLPDVAGVIPERQIPGGGNVKWLTRRHFFPFRCTCIRLPLFRRQIVKESGLYLTLTE